MLFVLQSRSEIDLPRIAALTVISGNERPKVADRDRLAVGPAQLALKFVSSPIKDIDRPVAEIPDQKIARELSKAPWRDCESLGRVERPAGCHSIQEAPVEIEFVYEAVPRTGDIIFLGTVLQREGNE